MANINKIRLSGQTYNIEDVNATKTVELTQAQYDALTVKDPNTFYIITDSQGVDLSNYYTKSETSGATEISTALASKADTATTYSKTEVDTALASKQTTLTAGTNITIVDNVINAESSGKAVSGGTNISITTGETADTINCTLRAANTSGTGSMKLAFLNNTDATGAYSVATGYDCKAKGNYSFASGRGNNTNNYGECAVGFNNKSVGKATSISKSSGCTLFSVGNGQGVSNSELHNAFEVRQNGDIYITLNDQDVKLQDQLGGGASYTAGDGIDITNDVISVTGKVDTTAFTAHTADTTIHVTSAEKSTWNAKSDFSGDYNDLTNKPTIPSKTSDLTNDSNFATTGDVQTATNDMATKTWVGQQGYLTEHQSLSNYYTKSETSGATEISTALNAKADTATTYTKTEVDNAITAATSTKQDQLVSGTNIKTINNESILGSGNIEIQGGSSVNVVQTTGTSTADVMSQDAVTTQLNNKANKSAAVGGYKFGSTNNVNYLQYKNVNNDNINTEIYYPKINGKGIFTNNSTYAQNNYNFQLVETSAITSSVTSSSTDVQVPSAKAVNDKLGGLNLVKLTQSEYDALSTKDSNTLYIING